MSIRGISVLLLVVFAAACGSDSGTGPSQTYDNIAGSYSGPVNSVHQGVQFSGSLGLTITQTGGSLGGSYAANGVLSDGIQSVQVGGTGTISGSVTSGTNPTVSISLHYPGCPNIGTTFTGVRDSANRRVVVIGTANFYYSDTCEVFHSHPMQVTIQQ